MRQILWEIPRTKVEFVCEPKYLNSYRWQLNQREKLLCSLVSHSADMSDVLVNLKIIQNPDKLGSVMPY